MKIQLPQKPKRGEPCNGCGFCCASELCLIGKEIFGENQKAPCPLLMQLTDKKSGKTKLVCDLVIREKISGLEPKMSNMLGIGIGCDSDD